jgi:hypothetical protein
MPPVKELLVLADEVLVHAAPSISAKLATALPEIFGAAGKGSAALTAAPAAERALVNTLVTSFEQQLQRFGLPGTGTPAQLYNAAKASDLDILGTTRSVHRHALGDFKMFLDDSTVISRSVAAGRSGGTTTTAFEVSNGLAKLVEERSAWFGAPARTSIRLETPTIKLESALNR